MSRVTVFTRTVDTRGLNEKLDLILKGQQEMADVLADLQLEIARNKTVEESAITLIQGLGAKLDAAVKANDMSGVIAIRDALKSQDDELAAAIAANTPAATPPIGDPANPEPPLA